MRKANNIERLTTSKLLNYWSKLPNPSHAFFRKHEVDERTALRDISYSAEVQSAVLARESAVVGDTWDIIGEKEEIVNFIKNNFKDIKINHIFREIFSAIWFGYTVLQHPMEKINGKWTYIKINSLPSNWFAFSPQGELIPSNNMDMTPMNTIIGDIEKECELVQYRESFVNPYGESQLARVFWSATYIMGNLHMWSSFIDRFGDDSLIAKADMVGDNEKMGLMQAISDFRSSGGIVLENTQSLEVLNTNKNASALLFKSFHEVCTQQISKLILGHASALEAQAGKLGNDEALSIVRGDITQDDKVLIADTMNRLIKHLCLVNNFSEIPQFEWVAEREDEKQKIDRDKIIADMGFVFSEEYIRKAYRFGESDIRKQEIKQEVPMEFAEGRPRKKLDSKYFRDIDKLIEGGSKSLKKKFSKFYTKILKTLEKANYWKDGVANILQVGNDFEIGSEEFALKLFNSMLIGRSQIQDETNSLQGTSFAERDAYFFETFREAREYFEARFNLPYDMYLRASQEMKQYAFCVGGILREDIIADISTKVLKAYDNGESFYKFKKELRNGKFAQELEELTNRRLELVYTQNMNSAYAYGRYQGLMEATDIFPNWEYITIGDGRVRSSHRALQGTIRRFDDPFWKTFYPPNGFRCRCVVAVSTKEPNNLEIENNGDIQPSVGFNNNVGDMGSWIKDRIQQMQMILETIPTRTSFFNSEIPLRNWDINKDIISAGTNYADVKDGLKKAEDRLKLDMGALETFIDKKGNIIGGNAKDIIEHISTSEKNKKRVFDEIKWRQRAALVDVIKDIIETGDIIEDVERYRKSGQLILSKKYIKNVKLHGVNTPVMIIAEYPKYEKDSFPIITTIYPVNNDRLSDRTGILLK